MDENNREKRKRVYPRTRKRKDSLQRSQTEAHHYGDRKRHRDRRITKDYQEAITSLQVDVVCDRNSSRRCYLLRNRPSNSMRRFEDDLDAWENCKASDRWVFNKLELSR